MLRVCDLALIYYFKEINFISIFSSDFLTSSKFAAYYEIQHSNPILTVNLFAYSNQLKGFHQKSDKKKHIYTHTGRNLFLDQN